MLGAGLKGIEENYPLADPIEENIFKMTEEEMKAKGIFSLPGSLREAVDNLEKSELMPRELLPPDDQPEKVGRRVFDLLEAVIQEKTRLGLHDKWTRHYRLGLNRPWRGQAPGGLPLTSANLLHLHRQRTVNTLTDNNPTFNVSRVGPLGDETLFTTLERAATWWWAEQEQQAVLERSVINGETYGVAVEKVVFDPDLEYGLGEVRTVVVDPFAFGIYPTSCLDIQDAEAVLHFTPMAQPMKLSFTQDVTETSPAKREAVGALRITADGRKFRYAKAGAAALAAGSM